MKLVAVALSSFAFSYVHSQLEAFVEAEYFKRTQIAWIPSEDWCVVYVAVSK